ncbi:UDP-glucose 4-epimerase GalE [Streptomyces sp. XM4011]|uniref:UDP-glucose 4-epimerase GalE n=1 Tax=Streptomyces sp. XM4011 TaxID=2929780 RepID=UPI001FFB9690|nr:UDP-glucose 4-epimerase GalE [Streptomyces sp. XM4011]MCK1815780.1 UDP-glucose 4-epimerase GalE [Streptomyces sp. XM4011]
MTTFLITGGAGYIGAHVVRALLAAGERPVVYDDLSTGVRARVPEGVPLVEGSTLDRVLLDQTIARHEVSGVIHLAAKKRVAESMTQPLRYYRENVHGLQILLEAVRGARIETFVFSSSASVYGTPADGRPVTEDTVCAPISPYGETKLIGEWLVRAAGRAHGISTACLRYFNVAGAAAPELGDTSVANLIPMVFERLDAGLPPLIFGDDYPTPDGTCVRDYIHVEDLAQAHVAAARALAEQPFAGDLTLNIGRGEGVSVREMATEIGRLTHHEALIPQVAARRAGDPAWVVARTDAAAKQLGWSARRGVREMISSAWAGWRFTR